MCDGGNVPLFVYTTKFDQSSVAEWLRWWVNQGVTPPLSDWEVVGPNLMSSFILGRNSNGFP